MAANRVEMIIECRTEYPLKEKSSVAELVQWLGYAPEGAKVTFYDTESVVVEWLEYRRN